MSKELIEQRKLKEKSKLEKEFKFSERFDAENDEPATKSKEDFLKENPNIFLMNNLLLTVQFFENYERDVKILRKKWFKEFPLESHKKKCFYADSLFRESGAKVKCSSPQGINKNSQDFLHPLRIYISSDNLQAAFDPGNLSKVKNNVSLQYQFTVKMDERDEKFGTASLVLLKTPQKQTGTATLTKGSFNHMSGESKGTNEINFKMQENNIFKFLKETIDDKMLPNRCYRFATPEDYLTSVPIVKYRMNAPLPNAYEIPYQCFQAEELEKNLKLGRRIPAEKTPRVRNVLNSTAFKGYFCELLIQKLGDSLGLDVDDVYAGTIQEEFAILGHRRKIHIAPVIEICDWNNFVQLTKNRYKLKGETIWPTDQMWKVMKMLPCYAVPNGLSDLCRKNLDHETKWKLVFPKTEQFLLLHMMHSQIRCYFFILSVYKSFIEPEINAASLGPMHLLHLLFWRVHKNFFAWPEERPAETLLNYFKVLYKKLQNKFLRDFFINSRNLFASSLEKDLHKAQAVIKIILQNPLPHILQAITNLRFDSNFYPTFDAVKVNTILSSLRTVKIQPKMGKKKRFEKKVRFQDGEQDTKKEQIISIDNKEIVNFEMGDSEKTRQIFQVLILHYVEMGNTSVHFKFLNQAFMYLLQTLSLFKLLSKDELNQENVKELKQKINELKEKCVKLEREENSRGTLGPSVKHATGQAITKLKNQQHSTPAQNVISQNEKKGDENFVKNFQKPEFTDENEKCDTKL